MTKSAWRRCAAAVSATGLMMVGLAALTPPIPAGADAPGTVKIVVNGDELVKQPGNVDNDPHVDCGFHIVFNGFDSLKGKSVTANIQIQSPSTPVDHSIFMKSGTINQSGYLDIPVTAGMLNFLGTVANHTENGNNDSDKADTADPNEITYHVTLDTSTTEGGDKIAKQKTFWIGGCEASPKIATSVSNKGQGTIGGTFTDSATLADVSSTPPTGTVTFRVYDNNACTGSAVFTSVKPISGTTVTSDGFTPQAVGTYYWIASYSGDPNNNPVAGTCGEAGEVLTIAKATPRIVTSAGATPDSTASAPSYIDHATVTGQSPTGTVTFKAWTNATCSGTAAFTSADRPLGSNGTATSAAFTPTPPAVTTTYYFVASYSGDANNAAAISGCTDAGESVTFTPGATQSAISTVATAAESPNTFTDKAIVTGGTGANAPTGTVTFVVYGPNDATCTGPFVTLSPSSTLSNGTATSAPFTALSAGTYTFIASYSGDAHNTAVAGKCDSNGETFTITKATPTISTTERASTTTAGSFTDTATLDHVAAGHTPSGTMTFRVYGPNDANCTGTAVTLSPPSTVSGLSTTSGAFTPPGPGTYTFIASYSGDAFNSPVAGHCSDANESFIVTPPPVIIPPPVVVVPPPVVLPSTATPVVTVVKTNDAGGNPFAKVNQAKAPSDPVDFQAVITNTSSESETITAIADQYGELTPAECPGLIGTVLAPGQSVTCSFTIANYAPPAGGSLTNTVTVNVRDTANQVASATDTSTVTSPPAVEATGGAQQPSATPPPAAPPPAVVTPPPAAAVLPVTASRTLPFTGANVWRMFLTGLGLLLAGVALWLKSYRVPGARHYA